MVWFVFFLFLLLLLQTTEGKYWVVKIPKSNRVKKQQVRIEHHLGNQFYVIYSLSHPQLDYAVEFVNDSSLQSIESSTLVKTDKACFAKKATRLAPQLFRLDKGDHLPNECIILDKYDANMTTAQPFAEISSVLQSTGIPIPFNVVPSIILVIDSGLDVNHCMFTDDRTIPFYTYATSTIPSVTTGDHSKVAAYIKYLSYSDWADGVNGHGTHVSGILAISGS
jgi:hypothetical protein